MREQKREGRNQGLEASSGQHQESSPQLLLGLVVERVNSALHLLLWVSLGLHDE